jgi:hypothetical protein
VFRGQRDGKVFASDTSEMLNKTMDAIAREIGEMNPDDPVRAQRLQELCALSKSADRSSLNKTR